METNQQLTTTKAKNGRPFNDLSWTEGHKFSARLTGHGRAATRFDSAGGLLSRIIPKGPAFINCSCACGAYTKEHPKAIRLDHLMAVGQKATVSCGCQGKMTYKQNAEFHTINKCSPALIVSMFAAYCRKPLSVIAIAKRYGVAAFMVCAAYRIHRETLAAKFGDWIRAGKLSVPCELGVRAWHLLQKHVLRNEPAARLELEDSDVTDYHQRFKCCLSPAFESSCFQAA